MFEHFLFAKSREELLRCAATNVWDLPSSLQMDIGFACTACLSRKTKEEEGFFFAEDGCKVIGFDEDRHSVLLKIDCLVEKEGVLTHYVSVPALIEYPKDTPETFRLCIGVADGEGRFNFAGQDEHVQPHKLKWYLVADIYRDCDRQPAG